MNARVFFLGSLCAVGVAAAAASCSDDNGFTSTATTATTTTTTSTATGGAGGGGAGGGPSTCTSDAQCATGDICEQHLCVPGCTSEQDCTGGETCNQYHCVPASCADGSLDGSETGVDCGGPDCIPCGVGLGCTAALDCTTLFCEPTGTGGAGGAPSAGVCAPCQASADCDGAPGTYCVQGWCVLQKLVGEACTAHEQCASGFCPGDDGVCCTTNCTGGCEACTAAKTGGADGTCGPIAVGTDPDAECTDEGAASCGVAGTGCNGNAAAPACTLYAADTPCAAAVCADGAATPALGCDGDGTCVSVAPTSCAPYACNSAGTDCLLACQSDADCDSLHFCSSQSCVPKKSPGDGCASGAQCLSGFCPANDGVCCDTACSGNCQACLASKTPSLNGTCDFIDGGTDPDSECDNALAPNCNGSGACSL
ncbi:MAG: hypothetical protein IT373_37280 [Polyangiaceae bacterium]|nr:hypothetical protein [Polyangiaceae bacterium]